MRELNPRAWSVDGECWCTRVDYDGYKEEWSGITPVLSPDNRSKRLGEIVDTNIIVELPTGLKDKNGKMIYIGDIVSERHGEIIGEIVQKPNGKYRIAWLGIYGSDSSLYDNRWLCEVIGNIHETPELLVEVNDVD